MKEYKIQLVQRNANGKGRFNTVKSMTIYEFADTMINVNDICNITGIEIPLWHRLSNKRFVKYWNKHVSPALKETLEYIVRDNVKKNIIKTIEGEKK